MTAPASAVRMPQDEEWDPEEGGIQLKSAGTDWFGRVAIPRFVRQAMILQLMAQGDVSI